MGSEAIWVARELRRSWLCTVCVCACMQPFRLFMQCTHKGDAIHVTVIKTLYINDNNFSPMKRRYFEESVHFSNLPKKHTIGTILGPDHSAELGFGHAQFESLIGRLRAADREAGSYACLEFRNHLGWRCR